MFRSSEILPLEANNKICRYLAKKQGSLWIRQWTINRCTSLNMVYKPSLKLKLSMKTFSNHSISKGVVSRNALELILANRIFFAFQCYKLYLKGIPIPERILVYFQVVIKISILEIARFSSDLCNFYV